MDDRLTVSFDSWTYRRFAPEIQSYSRVLLERVIPIFDEVDNEQERASDEVLRSPHWGPDDFEQAMETAYETGIEKALEFMELRSVFIAIGVSGMFHLFEKQLYTHLNHELRFWLVNPINKWHDVQSVIRKFNRVTGPDESDSSELWDTFSNSDLTELRLLANAIKHGEGPSYEQLKKMGAAIVSPDRLGGVFCVGPFSILGVSESIQPQDIERYRDAILKFWKIEGTFWASPEAFGK